MDLALVISISVVGILIFISTQLIAILFLLKQNKELNQDINETQPPF